MSSLTFAHATSLGADERRIFEHALALAAAANAQLVSVHAREGADDGPAPDPADVLRRWGKPDGSVAHRTFTHSCCDDPIDTLLDALKQVAPDLIIAGTHQRGGAARLLAGSQCEAILRNVTQPTLVFPMRARSFLTEEGSFDLRKIVIPIGDVASARTGLAHASWLGDVMGVSELDVELLYVGPEADIPDVEIPDRPGWKTRVRSQEGNVVEAVSAAAGEACVLVMATRGPDSLKDSFLGTHTERVLRHAACPVLITPISESDTRVASATR